MTKAGTRASVSTVKKAAHTGYEVISERYISRNLEVDIDLALSGKDPDAAERVLRFMVAEHDRGYPMHPLVEDWVVGVIRDRLVSLTKERAAYREPRPGVGVKPPAFDLDSCLGLKRASAGAPEREPSARLLEAAEDVLWAVLRGKSKEAALKEAGYASRPPENESKEFKKKFPALSRAAILHAVDEQRLAFQRHVLHSVQALMPTDALPGTPEFKKAEKLAVEEFCREHQAVPRMVRLQMTWAKKNTAPRDLRW